MGEPIMGMATATQYEDDHTHDADHIVLCYQQVFKQVHGSVPRTRHMSSHWFQVNGEIVHRTTLIEEINRLRIIARKDHLRNTNKSLIQRLIGRLRSS